MSRESSPLISVLIPAYNHERYVEKALRSFAEQDYPKIELVVINDGSTDETHDKIKATLVDIRGYFFSVKYLNQENQGVIETLNKAIDLSQGEYIYLGASDDYLYATDTLTKLSKVMAADEQIALVWADTVIVDDEGYRVGWNETQENVALASAEYSSTHSFFTRGREISLSESGTYKSLMKGNYVSNALLLRKKCLLELGGYGNSHGLEDYAMWLRLSKKYKLVFVDELLGAYRWHGSNTIKSLPNQIIIDFYLFLLGEKWFCEKNGWLTEWFEAVKGFQAMMIGPEFSSVNEMEVLSQFEKIALPKGRSYHPQQRRGFEKMLFKLKNSIRKRLKR